MSSNIISLKIDKILYKDGKIPESIILERKIVKAILDLLQKNGIEVRGVNGGDGIEKCDSVMEAMELIFDYGDSRVYFKNSKFWVFFVCGNEIDILSDYSTGLSDYLDNFEPESVI